MIVRDKNLLYLDSNVEDIYKFLYSKQRSNNIS